MTLKKALFEDNVSNPIKQHIKREWLSQGSHFGATNDVVMIPMARLANEPYFLKKMVRLPINRSMLLI